MNYGREYYDKMYDPSNVDGEGFRFRNWAVFFAGRIAEFTYQTVIDVGCGNGRFLTHCIKYGKKPFGVDITSNGMPNTLRHLFRRIDISEEAIPAGYDLLVSADVLEHILPDRIDFTLRNISQAARQLFLAIACYDDGHCHLIIESPQWWLNKFIENGIDIKLVDVVERKPGCQTAIFERKD